MKCEYLFTLQGTLYMLLIPRVQIKQSNCPCYVSDHKRDISNIPNDKLQF